MEYIVRDSVNDWKAGSYLSIMEMSNQQHDDLVDRQILFPDPDDYFISAGLGRDWPDGRGLYCDTWDDLPSIMIWCNHQDHIWVVSNAKGGDVQSVFTRLSTIYWALETSLMLRNHSFVEDRRLGFLNSSPANIGTGLRASVYVKLVRLGQHPHFETIVKMLRLEARPEYSQGDESRYTGIYDIGNSTALGKSEVELINIMIRGVGTLIALEKRLERGEEIDLNDVVYE